MINNLKSKFVQFYYRKQSVRFMAPLPIDECAKRLQESIGKPMGCLYTAIKGHIEKVDETTYQFTLYQDYRGGHKIAGHLYAQSDSTTLIDALHTVDRSSWLTGLFFVVTVVIIAFAVELPKGEVATAIEVSIVFVVVTAAIILLSLKAQSISQLLWWFERTLKQ
jgi:hypothetical protein